jgi:hypothetical protein
MMTQEQLNKIHELQSVAMYSGDHATYWALAVAIDFGLGLSPVIDIARVECNQGSKP